MRDLARSMFRFSWAMSVLGARQAANLLNPSAWDRSADAFDAVSHAAAAEMGDTMKSYYKAGDRLQSGMVDTVARMADGGSWSNPGKAMNDVWEEVDRTWTGVKEDLTQSPPEQG